jgi:hypothetical protein
MGVEKRHVARGGKNIIFRRGGGINIVFGPKYRPLEQLVLFILNSISEKHYYNAYIYKYLVLNRTAGFYPGDNFSRECLTRIMVGKKWLFLFFAHFL